MSARPDRWQFPHQLPRHAFSARNAARAGDVWRAFQEIAIEASTQAGWSPMRYREERSAFVVHAMTVVHHREAVYGEPLTAATWIRTFRRATLCTREVRLVADAGPVASGTQEWVHVDESLRPRRAPAALEEAFPTRDEGSPVALPAYDALEGPEHVLELDSWYTWMDPLDHINHPQYVDFCDEAISRVMARAGLRPLALRPIAERMTYSRGVEAPRRVRIRSRVVGRAGASVAVAHEVETVDDGARCASGVTLRALAGGEPEALLGALFARA